MSFLAWLEASSLGEWVRTSFTGYPIMITFHAIGMAIMVGLALAFAMRLLGLFSDISLSGMNRFLAVAWAGFVVNTLSGSGLFAARATSYIEDGTFLLKMSFVLAGMILVAILQTTVNRRASAWTDGQAPVAVRLIAVASIICWVGATVTGRLIAYL